MDFNSPLYPAWVKVREALQNIIKRAVTPTTGEMADDVVEALRLQLTNDTTEMTRLLHVGAAEAGWHATLLAFTRMALDVGYPCVLVEIHPVTAEDGWTLSHALLIDLPEGQCSWRLTFDQFVEMREIGVPLPNGILTDEPVFDQHDRTVKYHRLERFAKRDRRK